MQTRRWRTAVGMGVLAVGALVLAACGSAQTKPAADLVLSGAVVDGERVVKMTAKQYAFDPDPLVVSEGEKVRLEVTSTDVAHGIAIQGTGINRNLEPGKTETITFTAGKAGTYGIHCSVFCGFGHMGMSGKLVVLPAAAP